MPGKFGVPDPEFSEIFAYYARGDEARRLLDGMGQLERARTQELLGRFLPPPPAVIYDVGGGSGIYALWLEKLGYEVHLVDAMPNHIEQALAATGMQPDYPLASAVVGDARNLERADASVDAVLMLGPLYHLTARNDRLGALREALRVLRLGGVVSAVGISRFASTLVAMFFDRLDDPDFASIFSRDLQDGQHRNPSRQPKYFTTAFFHHPDELKEEIQAAGFSLEGLFAIEGPGSLLQDFETQWGDLARREQLLQAIRWLESEPSLIGVSSHMMAVGRKEG